MSDDKTIRIHTCGRGARARCACGNAATKQCDYPLKGRKEGQTCSMDLCERCARHAGPELDYCRAHDELTKAINEAAMIGLDLKPVRKSDMAKVNAKQFNKIGRGGYRPWDD